MKKMKRISFSFHVMASVALALSILRSEFHSFEQLGWDRMAIGDKRRRLIWFGNISALVFVTYGLADMIWIRSHPGHYVGDRHAIDFTLWLVNLPFFFFGMIWFAFRLAQWPPYLSFRTRYSLLSRLALASASLLGAAVLVAAAVALRHL